VNVCLFCVIDASNGWSSDGWSQNETYRLVASLSHLLILSSLCIFLFFGSVLDDGRKLAATTDELSAR